MGFDETTPFEIKTLNNNSMHLIRKANHTRLLNIKINNLKNKIQRYKNREKDVLRILKSNEYQYMEEEQKENLYEESKLIREYIEDYEKEVRELQKE